MEVAKERLGAGGLYGARMTGGGFGGCIVALVKASAAKSIVTHIEDRYKEETGAVATSYITKPGRGAHVISKPDPARDRARWITVGAAVAFFGLASLACPKLT